jgi:P-type Cu+ transporter
MGTGKVLERNASVKEAVACYHCGDDISRGGVVPFRDKAFCCEACRTVFEILQDNQLDYYYSLNEKPGKQLTNTTVKSSFAYLDEEKIRQSLIVFSDGTITQVNLLIPAIHCSSCLWLIENLHRIEPGIISVTVNFLSRVAEISFNESKTSLRKIAELLQKLGYSPHISFDQLDNRRVPAQNRMEYYRLGVAFFCFGNIMLLSFPEYFGLHHLTEDHFSKLFGYLNIVLSLPVLLFSDVGFFKSAWNGIKHGRANMDVPISLGILIMFLRSVYEIIMGISPGYMDTFAGLVFFMLVGRMFQSKSFDRLSFERDFRSYFPLAATVSTPGGLLSSKLIGDISVGDRLIIHNEELIPADSILLTAKARIDYSFVTGESRLISVSQGEKVYAGGKQVGESIEVEVIKRVDQSRLTSLWNKFGESDTGERHMSSLVDRVSKVFTMVVLLVALTAAVYHLESGNHNKGWDAFTAVLIITCPCALALSYPFAMGNAIRILGNRGLFLKNTRVIEEMSGITSVVFDKTGTITQAGKSQVSYQGVELVDELKISLASILGNSLHPLSRLIYAYLDSSQKFKVVNYLEQPGLGLSGEIGPRKIKIGSLIHIGKSDAEFTVKNTSVHWSLDDQYMGTFLLVNDYRNGLTDLLRNLKHKFTVSLISGDSGYERERLVEMGFPVNEIHFNQTPDDKLSYISKRRNRGEKVLMLGDGLNDAGALKTSNCGLAIADDMNNFTPASDGILHAGALSRLPNFLLYANRIMWVIYSSYLISIVYNIIGVSYAVTGSLSPLVAAIIMPMSTVTIIAFTTGATRLMARNLFNGR